MDINVLIALRPSDGSSGAIRRSIVGAEKHRIECLARLAECKSDRGQLLLNGSVKEIKDIDCEVDTLKSTVSDLDDMLLVLKEDFKTALHNEHILDVRSRIDALGYEAGCTVFAERWKKEYKLAAMKVASLCAMEAELIAKRRMQITLVQELEALGEVDDLPSTWSPAYFAGARHRKHSLCEMVRLPGERGAPELVTEIVTGTVTRRVPNPVYNENLRTMTVVGEKDITEDISETRPVCDDAVIWWPRS